MNGLESTGIVGQFGQVRPDVRASSGTTMGRMLANQAKIRPKHVAVSHPGGELTYAELNDQANTVAQGLLASGVGTHDRIAVLAENRVEYVVLFYAAAKIGAAVAALNWRQVPEEIANGITLVDPVAVVSSQRYAGLLEQSRSLLAGADADWLSISFDPEPAPGKISFQDLAASGSPTEPGIEVDPESCLSILYTSGTTGPSKGAAISHRALVARAGMMAAELRLSRDDAFIGWAPMFHMVTTDYMFITAVLGGTFVVIPGFDAAAIVEAIAHRRVGWFVLVPGTVDAVIEALESSQITPLGIRAVGAMADLIPPAKIARLTELLGCPFFNSFGSTETGTIPSAGALLPTGVAPVDFGKEQSAFCDVLIVTQDGLEADVDQEGELLLRGLSMFSGYWNDEDATAAVFQGGWYRTGDIFTRSEDGLLHFAGRRKYMIKSGGENIYPSEIERVLLSHEAVVEAVVVRAPDDRWGEVPRAFVALAPGANVSAGDLEGFCRGRLAGFMRPKLIELIPEERFPRNSTGKVLRAELEKLPTQTIPAG